MKKEINFYYSVIKKGRNKGELNTLKTQIKYTIRFILLYQHAKKLANFIISHKYLKDEVYRYPVLCSKIHRPYLTNSLNTREKVDSIISSYSLLDKLFSQNLLKDIYRNGNLEICSFTGKDGNLFKIILKLYPNYDKEGEFTLICYNHLDKPLAKLTFGFHNNKIIIGGLQGLEKGEDKELIKEATKNMYGLFPKKLLLEILYFLFPNHTKIGVGKNKHIYFSIRYKHRKEKKIHADYDNFWESINGINKNGLWLLPRNIERKNLLEIPVKKRSLYTKRFTLLEEIKNSVENITN